MKKNTLFLLLINLLWIHPIHAKNLLEVYEQARQSDSQLKIVRSEYLATLEKKPQASSQLLPQVTVDAGATERHQTKNWMIGDSFENTAAYYNVSLRYALYRRDKQIQEKQADNQILQAEADYDTAQQTLIEQVANRYFNVLAAEDNLEFARSTKNAIHQQLKQAKERFDVGVIAITEVQESQAGYDLAVAEEIEAKNTLDNARESLREITSVYYENLASLTEELPLLLPDPEDIDAWTETALQNNPKITALQYAVKVARQEVQKQRTAYLPTVDLVGNHGYNDVFRGNKNPLSNNTDNSVGIQLNYFIYQGGAKASRVREAKQRLMQTLDRLEQIRRTVQREMHNAYLNVVSNISRVKAFKQALTSTETALDAIQAGFEVGTRTSVDVLNAQRDLLRAQRNYARARYDYLLNTLRLKQAAGLIAVEDIENINKLLK